MSHSPAIMEPSPAMNLHSLFEWKNEEEICDYLEANSDLIPYLPEVIKTIRTVFGDAPLALEVVSYFDSVPGDREMWITVKGPPDVEKAIDDLRCLDTLWLETFPRPILHRLHVDMEF